MNSFGWNSEYFLIKERLWRMGWLAWVRMDDTGVWYTVCMQRHGPQGDLYGDVHAKLLCLSETPPEQGMAMLLKEAERIDRETQKETGNPGPTD